MSANIDLHMHTSASDGTDSPLALLRKIEEQEIRVFSVTDHDTIDGALALESRIPQGVRYIRGIEFSCVSPCGKCHILGYGWDPADPVFLEALETGRQLRQDKLSRRITFLEEQFGIVLTEEELQWLATQNAPGKPHLGRILMKRGLAKDLTPAIQQYINPCKGGADRIPADLAIRAIDHAGGIPVWAHPLGGEGERRLTGAEFEAQLRELMSSGIRGLECFYSRYDDADIRFLVQTAQENSLLVSGGSDYHGANKADIQPGKLNKANQPVDAECLTVLRALQ